MCILSRGKGLRCNQDTVYMWRETCCRPLQSRWDAPALISLHVTHNTGPVSFNQKTYEANECREKRDADTQRGEINPPPLNINIHFLASFTSLWFLVNTLRIRQGTDSRDGVPGKSAPTTDASSACAGHSASTKHRPATRRSVSLSRFPEHQGRPRKGSSNTPTEGLSHQKAAINVGTSADKCHRDRKRRECARVAATASQRQRPAALFSIAVETVRVGLRGTKK